MRSMERKKMLTTTEVRSLLAERGIEVSYPTVAMWVREGKFPGAQREETPRGPLWYIPRSSVETFEPPPQGRPPKPQPEATNGRALKPATKAKKRRPERYPSAGYTCWCLESRGFHVNPVATLNEPPAGKFVFSAQDSDTITCLTSV